jgi:hypothetical protein
MHDQPDYYESDFADDDPRLELMLDADTDLRLLSLWQFVAEVGDVLDDAGRKILAVCIRQAYANGYEDGSGGREHSLPEYQRCEPWQWGRFPEHDKLPVTGPIP